MIYYLIGYMCCGKTKTGKVLSKKKNILNLDLDKEIEKRYNKTISELFNIFGEDRFRDIETNMLKELSEKYTNCIISTGGGTPIKNIEYMKSKGTVIYLKRDPIDIIKGLTKYEIDKRPRLKNFKSQEELNNFIIFDLREREKIYNQADIIINDYEKFINS